MATGSTYLEYQDEVELENYEAGGKKLRLLGLLDPEKGLREASAALERNHGLKDAIRVTHEESLEVLDGAEKSVVDVFETPVLLVRDDENLDVLCFHQGLAYKNKENLFDAKWGGYTFGHRFMRKRREEKTLSTVHIDSTAIDDTLKELGENAMKDIEKSLGALLVYANHDYTIHRHGLAVSGDTTGITKLIFDKVRFDLPENIAASTEVSSAIFHRDMLDEISELGHPIFDSIEKQSRTFLGHIEKITNPDLQKYWLTVFKYPLFSLVNPKAPNIAEKLSRADGREEMGGLLTFLQPSREEIERILPGTLDVEEKSMVERLREDFPSLNLDETQWGKVVHSPYIGMSFNDGMDICSLPVRELRKVIMKGLRDQDKNTPDNVAVLISKHLGYPQTIQGWDDLERVAAARELGLPDDTPIEDVEIHELYQNLRFDIEILEGDKSQSILGKNVPRLYKDYLYFKDIDGFDLSFCEEVDWGKALGIYFKETISIHVSAGMDFGYIELKIEKAQNLGCNISVNDFPELLERRKKDFLTHIENYRGNPEIQEFYRLRAMSGEIKDIGYDIQEVFGIDWTELLQLGEMLYVRTGIEKYKTDPSSVSISDIQNMYELMKQKGYDLGEFDDFDFGNEKDAA